jgi:hypothetical protein
VEWAGGSRAGRHTRPITGSTGTGTRSIRPAGIAAAYAAAAVGVLYAAVSAYWGAGGTALLDTVGGALERKGRAGEAGLLAIIWLTVAVKLAVSAIGVLAGAPSPWSGARRRPARRVAWVVVVVLVLYGGVLTVVGQLIEVDIIHRSADANAKALRWHAFLWDPWFLLWGLLLAAALLLSRSSSDDAA